jgi:hypothetical protein
MGGTVAPGAIAAGSGAVAKPSDIVSKALAVTVQGPYEAAIIEGFRLLEIVLAGQDAATKKELWTRYLEFSAPFHDVSVAINKTIGDAIVKLLTGK